MSNEQEIIEIKKDIDILIKATYDNKIQISSQEVGSNEKYSHLLTTLTDFKKEVREDTATITKAIRSLEILATKGSTSLRTLLWVGSFIGGATLLVLAIINSFPKI